MTPSPFDTDFCCGYVTSSGSHHVVAFIKCLILRRMQQIVYTNNTEAARDTQTLGGKHRLSSEILYVTYSYHCLFLLQILKLRAQTEGIQIDDESLNDLGQHGVATTLR